MSNGKAVLLMTVVIIASGVFIFGALVFGCSALFVHDVHNAKAQYDQKHNSGVK